MTCAVQIKLLCVDYFNFTPSASDYELVKGIQDDLYF